MTRQNFTILIFNGMRDDIFMLHLKAKDKMEARELIEPNLKSFDVPIVLNEAQLMDLNEKMEAIRWHY